MDQRPAPDPRRFRDAMGLLATGIAVIVGRAGDEVLAMTVNAVSSLSLDPMLALFCPGKRTKFAQRLLAMHDFTINFLALPAFVWVKIDHFLIN